MSRRRLLLVTLAVGLVMPASAVAAPGVGHRVERLDVPGAAPNELRKVDVHVWYPAGVAAQPKTVYTSALYGKAAAERLGAPVMDGRRATRARSGTAARAGRTATCSGRGNAPSPASRWRTFTTLARLLAPTRAAAWIADANRIGRCSPAEARLAMTAPV